MGSKQPNPVPPGGSPHTSMSPPPPPRVDQVIEHHHYRHESGGISIDGLTPEQQAEWRALVKPIFLKMYREKIGKIAIACDGTNANLSIWPTAKETPNAAP